MNLHGGRAAVALLCIGLSGCALQGPGQQSQGSGEPAGGSRQALELSVASVLSQIDTAGPYSSADIDALKAADLGIAGTAVAETALADDGSALCFSLRRTAAADSVVLTAVVGSGAVGRVEGASCAAALPVALPALAYDALVAGDLERVLAAVRTQPEGAPITSGKGGLRVGDRAVPLSDGVSLVDADTGFGRVCVALGEEGSYIRSVDSLLGDVQPRSQAVCTTELFVEGGRYEVGDVAAGRTLVVGPVGEAGSSDARGLEPWLEGDITPVGRQVIGDARRADEAVLASNATRIAAYLDDAAAAGALSSVGTQEEAASWALDGPEGTLFLPDNLRWDPFERSAAGWCMQLLWNDRTAPAAGGTEPPPC